MSLYHEAAGIVTGPSTHGGSLKSRTFGNKDLKSPPAQVYALALESSKWSGVLKEVVEKTELLQKERKLTPVLSILLVHDLLLAKGGIALPASHGLRAAVDRHKARLQSEFTRARIRRKCPTVEALKAVVDAQMGPAHPRWVRVNSLKSTVDEQLDTTFKGFAVVASVQEVMASAGKKVICLDSHVPNLIAAAPGTDLSRTEAYKTGKLIFQDKASCFPAYLLDPRPGDGDIIDACSAPGNKTTHLASILHERGSAPSQRIFAFEKDKFRAKTLQKMVTTAGSLAHTTIHAGADFLQSDPHSPTYANVTALLLDPSCSGSGIVGRDDTPEFHLPSPVTTTTTTTKSNPPVSKPNPLKRKTPPTSTSIATSGPGPEADPDPLILIDDAGTATTLPTPQALRARLAALAAFQLAILLHAFAFPAAARVVYSTCSVHAAENEDVVRAALRSEVARARGWRVLRRAEQVRGMREWEVRGLEGGEDGGDGEEVEVEEAEGGGGGDGGGGGGGGGGDDGPFVRDADGRIVRDGEGIPTLKSTGRKAVDLEAAGRGGAVEIRFGGEGEDGEGPFVRDKKGRIVRDSEGIPTLKSTGRKAVDLGAQGEEEDDDDGWGGFDD
ncbi:S-adenosyl-L-methionine-dependent methyltransferase [Trichocladium antarcticum]|uniref:S-adenosyl-L-methionine-dependent methyltransferase n=1 Tax=Trichocladium antarcticum TaxID=1450529 RepID=A0AAN6ZG15_9PEZI|nr:S-adenosyl-L-methionine-dependent methyltransferase [Trichocladium antarcticum]